MDQEEANTSNTVMRMGQDSDYDNEAGPSKVVAVVDAFNPAAPNVEQTGDIFKLDIDCYEEAFDYLPFKDLVNVGKTCKRLQGVAGYCFQENFSGSAASNSVGIEWNGTDVKHFAPFIRYIRTGVDGLRYILDVRSQLRRLKQIRVDELKSVHMNRLKDIPMPKVEVLRVTESKLSKNFHQIIDHCTMLKRLEIYYCKGEFNWLKRKYPTLEYFKLASDDNETIEGIPELLELNPNIRKFTTTAETLGQNKDKFMSSDIKLDDFAIDYGYIHDDIFELEVDAVNKLHERGFYKNLLLYSMGINNQDSIDQLMNIKGLVKLYIYADCVGYPFTFSAFKNLEELFLYDSGFAADLETMANNLINLKRIHFKCSKMDHIMPFIRRSVEMQRIRVDYLESDVHFHEDTGIINLLALNKERERLLDAQKITLYVTERIYLATKWAMKGNDFGLIRLKRIGSYDWGHDYDY